MTMKNSTLNLLSILCGTMLFSGACDTNDGPELMETDTISIATLAPFSVKADPRPTPSASTDLQAPGTSSLSVECDVWTQDCPEGQKCATIADDGGFGTSCVDVIGMGQPGDACTSEGEATGIDSCAEDASCWDIDMDGAGTCVARCTGTQEAPSCDPGSNGPILCTITNEGLLNLCIPDCNPLEDDCAADEVCVPQAGFSSFICAP